MEEKKEMVNHPEHYNHSYMECIDGMLGAFGSEEVRTFCKISAFKYLWRLGYKDDEAQEIGKIKWYLDKYLELTQPPIGLRLDTGEPAWVNELSEEMDVWQRPALLKKGLTNKQIDDILGK